MPRWRKCSSPGATSLRSTSTRRPCTSTPRVRQSFVARMGRIGNNAVGERLAAMAPGFAEANAAAEDERVWAAGKQPAMRRRWMDKGPNHVYLAVAAQMGVVHDLCTKRVAPFRVERATGSRKRHHERVDRSKAIDAKLQAVEREEQTLREQITESEQHRADLEREQDRQMELVSLARGGGRRTLWTTREPCCVGNGLPTSSTTSRSSTAIGIRRSPTGTRQSAKRPRSGKRPRRRSVTPWLRGHIWRVCRSSICVTRGAGNSATWAGERRRSPVVSRNSLPAAGERSGTERCGHRTTHRCPPFFRTIPSPRTRERCRGPTVGLCCLDELPELL